MCTKKTSGIALLVIGFILVALGVIIGLILPNKAQTTVEDNVCVDSKDSPGYDRWVSLLAIVLTKKKKNVYYLSKPCMHTGVQKPPNCLGKRKYF